MKNLKYYTLLLSSLFILGCTTESVESDPIPESMEVVVDAFDNFTGKGGNKPSVKGQGTREVLKRLPDGTFEFSEERFVFSAVTRKNGKIEGNAVYDRPEGKIQVDITCLRYAGTVVGEVTGIEYKQMVVSGLVKRSDVPFVVEGEIAIWAVLDGGDIDFVGTPVSIDTPRPIDCNIGFAQTVRLVNNGDVKINIGEE